MNALLLEQASNIEQYPLLAAELPLPFLQPDEILVKIHVCGICHTDLHTVEGDIHPPKLPIIPGHQIVGTVACNGVRAKRFKTGERVGIGWLQFTCGCCTFCRSGRENLCDNPLFTGFHRNGGFAEYTTVHEDFAYPIPYGFSDREAAPLLCAGIIGYRSLKRCEIKSGKRLGLYGFGASAHIAIQIAIHEGCDVFVFTRGKHHQELASELGAVWIGKAEEAPPVKMDSAIIFAPAGELVPVALKNLDKGGVLALGGIHMSTIPPLDYTACLFDERTVRSVTANTRQDGMELMKLAEAIPIKTETQVFPLREANQALHMLKTGQINGAGILAISI
jgi:alcohol dehydrogenase, propanol-preferring